MRAAEKPLLSFADVCEHVFVPEYRYTLTEHDLAKPWLIRGSEQRTIALEDGVSFFDWAHEHWPAPRWTVELAPWQIGPDWTVSG